MILSIPLRIVGKANITGRLHLHWQHTELHFLATQTNIMYHCQADSHRMRPQARTRTILNRTISSNPRLRTMHIPQSLRHMLRQHLHLTCYTGSRVYHSSSIISICSRDYHNLSLFQQHLTNKTSSLVRPTTALQICFYAVKTQPDIFCHWMNRRIHGASHLAVQKMDYFNLP